MSLQYSYQAEADIPEDLRAHYRKEGDEWTLTVAGGIADKIGEFRDNNRKLFREAADLKAKLKDLDVDGYKAYLEDKAAKSAEELPPQGNSGNGQGSQQQARRDDGSDEVRRQVKALNDKIARLETERDDARKQAQQKELEQRVLTAASTKKIRPEAHEDVLLRAAKTWRFDDQNNLYAVAANGKDQLYSDDGPLTIEGWFDAIAEKTPHWYAPSTGSGAQGSATYNPAGARVLSNPSPEEFGKNLEAIASGKMVIR